ncbi:MAG: HPr family phosphocarrier protein [Anaeromicrobium sp.]|jgi:phosphocarrier protein|uniref:HPr family phosphocarrier protein n=1 Tax=Anaeromicrobium sp. TaxID=1929132 RepID=UPI0025F63F58|nr:HPr family phosphocarrier protein [Anaeromicrobium sp.]MCT4596131.1 HPr family phosphocarrier protein [Anaeromicrobium sp.]
MVKREIVVKEKNGLHARPAGVLVKECGKFKSNMEIEYKGKKINAKSIMGVMALGVKENETITIIGNGEDEESAVEAVVSLVESNFGL